MEKLKHCPFCGSEAYKFFNSDGLFTVCCRKCGAKVFSATSFDDAIKKWNYRNANIKPTRCPWCGRGQSRYERKSRKDLENYGVMYCPYCFGEGPKRPTKIEAMKAWRYRR